MKPAALVHEVIQPEGAGPHPTVLVLHGRGADEHDLLPLAQSLDSRLLIISVRAPHVRWGGYHWYDLIDTGNPEPETYRRALALLQEFVRQVLDAYPVVGGSVLLLGFSQGAMMAGSLLLTVPEQIAAAMLLSGYLPLDQGVAVGRDRLAGKPVFWGHGTSDRVLPVSFGRQARDYLIEAGVDLTYREYPMAHQVSAHEEDDMRRWLGDYLAKAMGGAHT